MTVFRPQNIWVITVITPKNDGLGGVYGGWAMGLLGNQPREPLMATAEKTLADDSEVEGFITPKAADDCVETQSRNGGGGGWMIPYISWDYKGYTRKVPEHKAFLAIKGQ